MFLYKNNLTNNKAYNLVITSALILVMSVIMASIIGFYNINNIEKRTIETQKKFQAIDIALTKFLIENNRFPCPAPLDCNQEGCDSPKNPIYGASIVGGEKKLGVELVIEKNSLPNISICQAIEDGTFSLENDDQEELIYGTVPVVSLGLDNTYMTDGWGNKIVYIIPTSLSNTYLTSENEEYSPIEDILTKDTISYNLSKNGEFVDDGDIFALLSHSSNVSGSYSFNSTKSNSFSNLTGNDAKNMPINKAKVDLEDNRFLKFSKNKMEFDEIRNIKEGGDSEPDCPATTVDYSFDNAVGVETCIPFDYTGTVQEFVVPEEVDMITVKLWGARGGRGTEKYGDGSLVDPFRDHPGGGGYSQGDLVVTAGQKFYLYIGGSGIDVTKENSNNGIVPESYEHGVYNQAAWNGGGYYVPFGNYISEKEPEWVDGNAGGGGATDIRTTGTEGSTDWESNLDDRIMVAGGGGGASNSVAGVTSDFANGEDGGHGCGLAFEKAQNSTNKFTPLGWEDDSHRGSILKDGKTAGYYYTGMNTRWGQQPDFISLSFGGGHRIYDTETKDSNGDTARLYASSSASKCELLGGGTYTGGGGYYAGGSTCRASITLKDGYIQRVDSCKFKGGYNCDKYPKGYSNGGKYTYYGGGAGGAGYVSTDFTNLKGDCGTWNSAGKAEICYVAKNNLDLEYDFSFPSAKYGELSYSKENCPYLISEPLKADDYYTLSSFKDKNGEIIDNKSAIKCGKDGKWIDATSNTPEAKYEFFEKCIPLPKCSPPSTAGERFDEWEYDFEIVNLGVVRNLVGEYGNSTNLIPGDKKIQCVVDKEGNAEYYNIKESEEIVTP